METAESEKAAAPAVRVKVIGVGNELCADDGVGIHTIRWLSRHYRFPASVELVEGGTVAADLLSELGGADTLIVVDAIARGSSPGTLYRMHPCELPVSCFGAASLHGFSLFDALGMRRLLSAPEPRIIVIGVEPASVEAWSPEPSQVVQARIPDIAEQVIAEIERSGVVGVRAAPA